MEEISRNHSSALYKLVLLVVLVIGTANVTLGPKKTLRRRLEYADTEYADPKTVEMKARIDREVVKSKEEATHLKAPLPLSDTAAYVSPLHGDGGNTKVLFLNATDAHTLLQAEDHHRHPHSIDVLVIGSKNKLKQAKVQRETWASHKAVRHFFISTEYDDEDPECATDATTQKEFEQLLGACRTKEFWASLGASGPLINYFTASHLITNKGWICTQRRFITSLTKLIKTYSEAIATAQEGGNQIGVSASESLLPDYLIFCDDDTYVDIDYVIRKMMPSIEEGKEAAAVAFNDKKDVVTTAVSPNTPVITAGCRIRIPIGVSWTFPYGGYGTFFSRGSLRRLIHPLRCNNIINNNDGNGSNDDMNNLFERLACQKLLKVEAEHYPMSATVGEGSYFNSTAGDSLNDVFYKYSRKVKSFCLHSDWFTGYMSNFYDISRQAPPNDVSWIPHNVSSKYANSWQNRLHVFEDSERSNGRNGGQCAHDHAVACVPGVSRICHKMSVDKFISVHKEVQKLRPEQ